MGYIYILTNPSFPQYVKIGYATDVNRRLNELNRSTAVPFAFRVFATYEVDSALSDKKLHAILDKLNPELRSTEEINGRQRVREFYAMTPDDAFSILEGIAEINGYSQRLKKWEATDAEQKEQALAEEIEEQHQERMAQFTFAQCRVEIGDKVEFSCNGNAHDGSLYEVIDDKHVIYNGESWSLTALAKHLLNTNRPLAGPRFFKHNGIWLNDIRYNRINK